MKKSGWKFLVGIVLVAVVFGACAVPFGPPEDPVEYDAQGRRLVTINVDVESAARAVNLDIAKAYIDFYEVVFERVLSPDNEYYSATTTKGAGKRLSLRVPADGDYKGYLNAGYVGKDGEVVLLAQASVTAPQAASAGWTFNLKALKLNVKESTPDSAAGDPIYVKFNTASAPTLESNGIPYYKPTLYPVIVEVKPKFLADVVHYYGDATPADTAKSYMITPLTTKAEDDNALPPAVDAALSGSPVPTDFVFSFPAPTGGTKGLVNIGFDVAVAAVATTRNNGVAPVCWHIRNGFYVEKYDNGATNATNTGAGLVFAFGDVQPQANDIYTFNMIPPASSSVQ
jgi:hypothetical protein